MKTSKALLLSATLLLLTALFCPTTAVGQRTWEINMGFILPLGDFGDGNYNQSTGASDIAVFDYGENGAADMGVGLGVGTYIPWATDNMYFCLRGDFLYTWLSSVASHYLDDVSDYLDQTYGGGFMTKRIPKYFNIPIMAGVRYKIPLREEQAFFFEGEAGLNFRYITKYKCESDNIELVFDYESANTFMFRVGFGFQVKKNFSLSLYYYDLGKSEVVLTTRTTINDGTNGSYTNNGFFDGNKLHTTLATLGLNISF